MTTPLTRPIHGGLTRHAAPITYDLMSKKPAAEKTTKKSSASAKKKAAAKKPAKELTLDELERVSGGTKKGGNTGCGEGTCVKG
jgi:hypothetical protein